MAHKELGDFQEEAHKDDIPQWILSVQLPSSGESSLVVVGRYRQGVEYSPDVDLARYTGTEAFEMVPTQLVINPSMRKLEVLDNSLTTSVNGVDCGLQEVYDLQDNDVVTLGNVHLVFSYVDRNVMKGKTSRTAVMKFIDQVGGELPHIEDLLKPVQVEGRIEPIPQWIVDEANQVAGEMNCEFDQALDATLFTIEAERNAITHPSGENPRIMYIKNV